MSQPVTTIRREDLPPRPAKLDEKRAKEVFGGFPNSPEPSPIQKP